MKLGRINNMKIKSTMSLIVALCLTGCGGISNQSGGALIGGVSGALLGTQFGVGHGRLAGVAVGTMLGAFVGGAIGRSMDQHDKQLAANATYKALEKQQDNETVTWKNPNKKHSGTVKVTNTEEDPNKVCRDYIQTVTIDGKQQEVAGRACRDVRDIKALWVVQ